MAKLNRKVVVLFLVLVVSAVITAALVLLLRGQRDPTVYIQQARQQMEQEQYEEALMSLSVARSASGGRRADVFAMMAECEQKKRPEPDLNKAIVYLKEAVKVATGDEDRLGYKKTLVDLLTSRGRHQEALPEVTDLVAAQPQNDEYLRMLALIRLRQAGATNNTADRQAAMDQANEAIGRALAAGPSNLENYQYKVFAIDVAAKFDPTTGPEVSQKAEVVVREAMAKVKDEQKAEARIMLAAIQLQRAARAKSVPERTKLLNEAGATYQEALKIQPGYLPALLKLAELAAIQGDPKVQEDRLREAVSSNPTSDEAYGALMEMLRSRNQLDEVLKVGVEALEKCPPAADLRRSPAAVHRHRVLMLMAETLISQNKSAEAGKYIEQITAIRPGDPSISSLLGQIAYREGKMDEAYKEYSKAIDLMEAQARRATEMDRRDLQRRAQTYFNRGLVLLARNLPSPAGDDFRQAETLLRDFAGPEQQMMIWRQLATAEFASGNAVQAEKEARKVLGMPGQADDYLMLRTLAASLLNQGKDREALVEARKCVAASPQSYEGYVIVAAAQGRLRQASEQEQTLRQGLSQVSKEGKINLYQALLSIYRARAATDKEAALLAEAQADEALTPEAKQRLSVVLKDPDERLKILREQLAQDPENPARVTQVADALIEVNQIGEAVTLYKQGYDLALKKDDRTLAKTIWDRAWVLLLATDQAEEAKAWIDALPADMVTDRGIAQGLGHMMDGVKPPASEIKGLPGYKIVGVQKQHFLEAIQVFEGLVKESQQAVPDPRLARALAQCYVRLALVDEPQRGAALGKAEANLLNVIALVPQDLQARFDLAGVYLQQGDPDKALTQLNLVLDKAPANVRALLLKAEALARKPDRDEAMKVRLRIYELAKSNADNLLALGLLYESFGKNEEALVKFQEASEAAPDSPAAATQYALRVFVRDARKADGLMSAFVDRRMRAIDASAVPAGITADELKAGVRLVEAEYYRDTQAGDAARAAKAVESAKKAIELAPANAGPVLFYSRLLLDSQDVKGAAKVCRDFLSRQSGDLAVQMQLCDILAASEETLDEAEERIRDLPPEILNSARAKTVLARTWWKMGLRAKKKNEKDEAVRLLRQAELKVADALKSVPDFGDAHVTLAQIFAEQGRHGEASMQLGNVKPGDRWYVQANLMKAQIDDALGDATKTRQSYLNVLKVEPRHIPARLSLVGQYVRIRDFASARSQIEAGLTFQPNQFDLMRAMIDVAFRETAASSNPASGMAQVQKWADRIVQAYPESAGAWQQWVRVMRAQGRAEEALKKMEEVRKARPTDAGLTLICVELLNALSRFDQSQALLKELIGGLPRDPAGKFPAEAVDLGSKLYVAQVDTVVFGSQKTSPNGRATSEAIAAARKILEEAMAAGGRNPILLMKLVKLHLEAGEPSEAVTVGQEIVKNWPGASEGWVLLGQSRLSLEQREEAYQSFLKATELDPGNAVAANNLAWDLVDRQKDAAKAWDYVSRALVLDPGNADFLDTAGWIKYHQNDAAAAIEYLERSQRAGPAAGTQYHLVMAYAKKSTGASGADKAAAEKKALELFREGQAKWPVSEYTKSTREAFEKAKTVLKDLKISP